MRQSPNIKPKMHHELLTSIVGDFLTKHDRLRFGVALGLRSSPPMNQYKLRSLTRASLTEWNLESARSDLCSICRTHFSGGFSTFFGVFGHQDCLREKIVKITDKNEPDAVYRRILKRELPRVWTSWVWEKEHPAIQPVRTLCGFKASNAFDKMVDDELALMRKKRNRYYEETKERKAHAKRQKVVEENVFKETYPLVYKTIGFVKNYSPSFDFSAFIASGRVKTKESFERWESEQRVGNQSDQGCVGLPGAPCGNTISMRCENVRCGLHCPGCTIHY